MWLNGGAAVAFLALALLAALRRARHPLAAHLGLMCVGLFAYDLQEVLSDVTHQSYWLWMGNAAAGLAAVATFELYLGFLGLTRQLAWARRMARVYFAMVGAGGLLPLVFPSLVSVVYESGAWAVAMLLGLVPCFGSVGYLLARHARRSAQKERMRALLLGGALLLGVGSVVTDLASLAGLALPRLSSLGLFLSSLLVAAFTFESRIIERVTVSAVIYTSVVALLGVTAQVILLSWVADRTAMVAFGSLVVGLISVAALVPILGAVTEQRARTQYLLTLGRFAQQMAHDVRNPLAAIKGTAQFLQQERSLGRSMDPHDEMISLIIERVDRIERFIRDYQRMGRVEPAQVNIDIRAMLHEALTIVGSAESLISVEESYPSDLPSLSADPDLLEFALENVVRNACEAMPDGGTIIARAELRGESDRQVVVFRIRDSGKGMDVRTLERALNGFFTTKEGGSGLGLAFARRVAEAHGGRLLIVTEEGNGTVVEVEIPTRFVVQPSS